MIKVVKASAKKRTKKPRGNDFLSKPVSNFATPPVIIFADDAVTDAAKLMRDKSTGSVLVAENAKEKGEPIGILTEWDLLSKVVAAERDGTRIRVREVMSSPVEKIDASARVGDALRIMLNRGIRRLAVMEDGALIGTVTQTNMNTNWKRLSSSKFFPIVEPIKGHICMYCASNFPTLKKLSEHIETMHEESLFLEMQDKQEINA